MNSLKVLFFHNTLPEYRLCFFENLRKKTELELIITQPQLEKKIYGFKKDGFSFDYKIFSDIDLDEYFKKKYDVIVLPPICDIKDYIISKKIIKRNKNNIPIISFEEKWTSNSKISFIKIIKEFVRKKMYSNILSHVNKLIVTGENSKKYFLNLFKEDKIFIVHESSCSFMPNDKKYNFINALSQIKLLFIGRLIERKGIIELIDIVEKSKENIVLIIAGKGPLESYVSNRNNKKIIYLGSVEPEHRAELYNNCDITIVPSVEFDGVIEAWGLVVNESLQYGTPVIASNIVGSALELINKSTGIIYKNKNELKKIINNVSNIYKSFSKEACLELYENNSISKMVDGFIKVFES